MNMADGILLTTCGLAGFSVGQVWLVQLSSYPLWAHVGPNEFRGYHLAWWHGIWGVILAPAALVTIGAVLMMRWHVPGAPGWMSWAGLTIQVALIAGTALWWAPLMAKLEAPDGSLMAERYRLLLATHWLRVFLVTAYGVVVFWMLAESAWRT